MKQASSCPTCGAPIYVKEQKNAVPEVFFTCECRKQKAMNQVEDPLGPYKRLQEKWERQRPTKPTPFPYPVYPVWPSPYWLNPGLRDQCLCLLMRPK